MFQIAIKEQQQLFVKEKKKKTLNSMYNIQIKKRANTNIKSRSKVKYLAVQGNDIHKTFMNEKE